MWVLIIRCSSKYYTNSLEELVIVGENCQLYEDEAFVAGAIDRKTFYGGREGRHNSEGGLFQIMYQ